MRKKGLRGAKTVFLFTLRQQMQRAGWQVMTLLPAILLLIGIPLAMVLVQLSQGKEEKATELSAVYVVDETGLPGDYAVLNEGLSEIFTGIEYVPASDADAALAAAAGRDRSLVLLASFGEQGYELTVLRPEGTVLTASDASAFASFLRENYAILARQRSGLTEAQLAELSRPVTSDASTSEEYRDGSLRSGYAVVREVLELVLPYLCIMVLYFMVLIYGQGIAGNVILEKSSKLMDTMLVSLQPEGMILGKTLAGWLAGVLQMLAWAVGCALGCVLGRFLVLQIDPGSTMGILSFFDMLGEASGLFTLPGVLLAAAIILAGFLMYCAIGSIGGALASKPEDLGSCNSLFTLLLLASFFLTMFGENSSGSRSLVANAAWMNYVPFTAVMSTPARALLGQVSVYTALISLVLTLAVALLAVLLAGRLYRLLVFRRGDPPKLKDVPALLKAGEK
ncbi:MAG: ABC transporter permease [Oscillospiraceae bacterium]|nr:ABC transporter permease [Oscillospiraceae bacterium]